MEHLKKVKAMNLVLSNSRENITIEHHRQNVAADKIERYYKRYYQNNHHAKVAKEKRKKLTERIQLNEMLDEINVQSTIEYKLKSFFVPKHFPKPPIRYVQNGEYENVVHVIVSLY